VSADPLTLAVRELFAGELAELRERVAALEAGSRQSPWMTRAEAAERLRVPVKTIDLWLAQGRLTRHHVGGARKNAPVRLDRAEVEALVVPEPGRRRAEP
jgi:excisionase family DNA binding protein